MDHVNEFSGFSPAEVAAFAQEVRLSCSHGKLQCVDTPAVGVSSKQERAGNPFCSEFFILGAKHFYALIAGRTIVKSMLPKPKLPLSKPR